MREPSKNKPSVSGWLASPLGHLQILMALAVLVGGGGVAYGFRNLTIQLFALALLWWHREKVWAFLRRGPVGLVILVLTSMALPLLQLVPLPADIWQKLPGREPIRTALEIAGLPLDSWLPLSMDRGRTLVAFCGTLAPAAIIVLGTSLSNQDKAWLAWTAAGAAFLALLLGVAQLSTANTGGLLYPIDPKADVLYATFANRNSTGLLFVLSIILLACVPLYRGRNGLVLATAGIGVFGLGAVLTQSRSGMALLGVALCFVLIRIALSYWRARRGRYAINRTAVIAAGLLGAFVVTALGTSIVSGGRAADSLARLTDGQTDRPQIWEDAVFAAEQSWPIGSGMGTFDEVFQLYESLEFVSPRRAGRAHNDYVELAMEAGAVGYLLALGWMVWIAQAAFRGSANTRWTKLGAALGLACIAAQSTLDYPLRNQTLLCVAAIFVVLLAKSRASTR